MINDRFSCFAEEGQVLHETKGVQSLAQVRSEIYADLSEVSPQLSVDRQHGNLKQPSRFVLKMRRFYENLKYECVLIWKDPFWKLCEQQQHYIFEESSILYYSWAPTTMSMSNLIQSTIYCVKIKTRISYAIHYYKCGLGHEKQQRTVLFFMRIARWWYFYSIEKCARFF